MSILYSIILASSLIVLCCCAGGGAPNESIRRGNIQLEEIFPEPRGVLYRILVQRVCVSCIDRLIDFTILTRIAGKPTHIRRVDEDVGAAEEHRFVAAAAKSSRNFAMIRTLVSTTRRGIESITI